MKHPSSDDLLSVVWMQETARIQSLKQSPDPRKAPEGDPRGSSLRRGGSKKKRPKVKVETAPREGPKGGGDDDGDGDDGVREDVDDDIGSGSDDESKEDGREPPHGGTQKDGSDSPNRFQHPMLSRVHSARSQQLEVWLSSILCLDNSTGMPPSPKITEYWEGSRGAP